MHPIILICLRDHHFYVLCEPRNGENTVERKKNITQNRQQQNAKRRDNEKMNNERNKKGQDNKEKKQTGDKHNNR